MTGNKKIKISKNFYLKEFLASDTADKNNIDNQIDDVQHLVNLTAMVNSILQPTRDHYRLPVIITSGYRNHQVNQLVNGSETSQHRTGKAVDFYVKNTKSKDVAVYMAESYDYDQLIYYTGTGHIHLSYSMNHNRKQLLIDRNGKLEKSNLAHFSLLKL